MQPFGTVGAALELRQGGEHAVVLGYAAFVGVAVALDQPAAAQDFDRERVVLAEHFDRGAEPLLKVLGLDAVAERAAAETAKAAESA